MLRLLQKILTCHFFYLLFWFSCVILLVFMDHTTGTSMSVRCMGVVWWWWDFSNIMTGPFSVFVWAWMWCDEVSSSKWSTLGQLINYTKNISSKVTWSERASVSEQIRIIWLLNYDFFYHLLNASLALHFTLLITIFWHHWSSLR